MGHVLVDMDRNGGGTKEEKAADDPSILRVMLEWYPSVPNKVVFLLGFLTALGHGIITPLWANYLSILMGLVASGGTDKAGLLKNSIISLLLSVGDGACVCLSYICFETVAYRWVANLRGQCFGLIVAQDKEWFDRSENSSATLVQNIIKDADDMAPIVSTIPGHFLTAAAMVAFGTIWAMTVGWKLTLVGVAVIPVFGLAIGVQFMLLNNVELRNKRMREEVAKIFYEVSLLLVFPSFVVSTRSDVPSLLFVILFFSECIQRPSSSSYGSRVGLLGEVRDSSGVCVHEREEGGLDSGDGKWFDERTGLLRRG